MSMLILPTFFIATGRRSDHAEKLLPDSDCNSWVGCYEDKILKESWDGVGC
jgi:hypothetical protein